MNTKHFLNLVAGNVFQSQTTPAIPTEYYIGFEHYHAQYQRLQCQRAARVRFLSAD